MQLMVAHEDQDTLLTPSTWLEFLYPLIHQKMINLVWYVHFVTLFRYDLMFFASFVVSQFNK